MHQTNVIEMPRRAAADILAAVKEEMEQHDISQTALGRQIGKSPTAISRLFGGSYPAEAANELLRLLEQWLESRAARRQSLGDMPDAPVYVETASSKRIYAALAYAQMAGDNAVIYGQPGIGKTCTATEYARRRPSVWIATMSPATASPSAALEEVCEALGLSDPGQSAARMQRAIIRRIRGSEGLLIIDEAQHLRIESLEVLRALNDATGVGMAYLGSEAVYTRMTGGRRAAELAQLFSRQGKRVWLRQTLPADIRALLAGWGIEDRGLAAAAADIGRKPGALRGLTKALRLASSFAGRGQALEKRHLVDAWRDLADEAV